MVLSRFLIHSPNIITPKIISEIALNIIANLRILKNIPQNAKTHTSAKMKIVIPIFFPPRSVFTLYSLLFYHVSGFISNSYFLNLC